MLGIYVWETNDDAAMAGISYGYYGSYESHLVFINIVYGLLLQCLQSLVPSLPWYLIMDCVILTGAMAILFYLILEKWKGWSSLLPISLFVVYFIDIFLGYLQFTKVAGLASAAGILLLFYVVEEDKDLPGYLAAFLLAWIGYCIRKEEFGLLLIPLFGVGIDRLLCFVRQKEYGKLKKLIAVFLVLFAGCAVLEGIQWYRYNVTPPWKNYQTYNDYRSQLLDYGFPDYEENRELYESLGISESDLAMFKQWDFADPEVFHVDSMKQLAEAREEPALNTASLLRNMRTVLGVFRGYSFLPALLIVLLLSAFVLDRRRMALVVYEVIMLFTSEVFLLYFGRALMTRIDAPLFLTVVLVILLYCCSLSKTERFLDKKAAVFVSLILLVPYLGTDAIGNNREVQEYYDRSLPLHNAYRILSEDKDTFYFLRTLDLSNDYYPKKAGDKGYLSNIQFLGGWLTESPITNANLADYGIVNPFRDMVDAEHIRLVAKEVTPVLDYIRAHYVPEAEAIPVRMLCGEYPVYRIITGAPELSEKTVVPWADGQWHMELTDDGLISGFLYRPETNSFAADIYLGLKPEGGKEQLYFTLQTILPDNPDLMNGQYAQFSFDTQAVKTGRYQVFLYLEAEDMVYQVDAGMLTLNDD